MLPLETFRAIFGLNPLHFWGLSNGSYAAVNSKCNTVTREHAWQDAQAVGRQEIREAIETAESRLREYLRYSVAPHYTSDVLPWPGVWHPTVQLQEGRIQAIGVEELTLIDTPSVTFSDSDGDGVDDTFTATVATTETDSAFLAVHFAAADRLNGEPAADRWAIAPVSISISSGTATITGRKWLLVKPTRYEGFSSSDLDPSNVSNFVTSIAISSRHMIDPQATLQWNTPGLDCCYATTDPAGIATATARVGIVDALVGIVAPAQALYDAGTATWSAVPRGCRVPDQVTINYQAGVPLVSGQMDPDWQVIVARLAAAELARPICACETANRALHTWQTDLARTGGNNDEQFGAISASDLDNPLGTRRGHVYAWRRIRQLRQARGFLPG